LRFVRERFAANPSSVLALFVIVHPLPKSLACFPLNARVCNDASPRSICCVTSQTTLTSRVLFSNDGSHLLCKADVSRCSRWRPSVFIATHDTSGDARQRRLFAAFLEAARTVWRSIVVSAQVLFCITAADVCESKQI